MNIKHYLLKIDIASKHISFDYLTNYKQFGSRMNIVIKKAEYLQTYALLEFKGLFQTSKDQVSSTTKKEHMRLGDITLMPDGKYMLHVGIMDLVGVPVSLPQKVAITETIQEGPTKRTLLIKGFAELKIQFHRRPVPIMDRVQPKIATKMTFGKTMG